MIAYIVISTKIFLKKLNCGNLKVFLMLSKAAYIRLKKQQSISAI